MSSFGPAWQAAQFNGIFIASLLVVPLTVGVGAMAASRRAFWIAVAVAFVASLILTNQATAQMWAIRADVAQTDAEREVLNVVQQQPGTASLVASVWRAGLSVAFWGVVGRLVWSRRQQQGGLARRQYDFE